MTMPPGDPRRSSCQVDRSPVDKGNPARVATVNPGDAVHPDPIVNSGRARAARSAVAQSGDDSDRRNWRLDFDSWFERGLSYGSYQTAGLKFKPAQPVEDRAHVTYWQGAALLKVSKTKTARLLQPFHGGVRGKATFSRKSRWRFMQKLAKTRQEELPKFVTLTYPGEFSGDPTRWKRDLKVFAQRLIRKFPNASGTWKLEPQKRGAPHYHLFIWGVGWQDLKEWISKAWFEVVGSGDERHLRAGTKVEMVNGWHEVKRYISKYLGKAIDTSDLGELWSSVGRFWGFFNSEFIPWGKAIIRECSEREAIEFMRLIRRFARMRAFGSCRNLSVVVGSADWWLSKLSPVDTS